MTTRPSRLMTSRPSRLTSHDYTALAPHDYTALAPHDFTALAPHDFTALAPLPRARSLDLRPERGPPPRYANCGRAIEGHQSRRHTGYVTALGRDCRGCLRIDATRSSQHLTVCAIPGPGQHLTVCAIPSSGQHLTVCAATSPSRHPTRRASAGGEGSTPNHPAALRSGMRMGFNSPGQHHTAHSPDERERTQVRLAARVVHRGGFGTCVPGAWTG